MRQTIMELARKEFSFIIKLLKLQIILIVNN